MLLSCGFSPGKQPLGFGKGSFGKGVYSENPFSRDCRELLRLWKTRRTTSFEEILENLESLEIPPVKRPLSLLIFTVGVECGENRGRTGEGTGGEPGAPKRTGGIWEENRGRTGGFWYSFTKSTGGEAGALGQEPGENRGEGIFFETRDPTRDLKINEQDSP